MLLFHPTKQPKLESAAASCLLTWSIDDSKSHEMYEAPWYQKLYLCHSFLNPQYQTVCGTYQVLNKCLLNGWSALLKHLPELSRPSYLSLKGSSDHNIFLLCAQSCLTLCDCKGRSPPGLGFWLKPTRALTMGFSRQEYWSGLPFPSPGVLLNPEIELLSLTPPKIGWRILYHWRHLGSPL